MTRIQTANQSNLRQPSIYEMWRYFPDVAFAETKKANRRFWHALGQQIQRGWAFLIRLAVRDLMITVPVFVVCFVSWLIYDTQHPNLNGAVPNLLNTPMSWSLYIGLPAVIFLMIAGIVHLFHFTNQNLNVALKDIPTPAQIATALQEEWGRSPTVEEVAAVQQMLNSRRNQALLNAGIGLGAIFLGAHIAKGRKL